MSNCDEPTSCEHFPYTSALGPTTIIGPQCFAMPDGSVLNWRGVNYVPQPDPAEPSWTEQEIREAYDHGSTAGKCEDVDDVISALFYRFGPWADPTEADYAAIPDEVVKDIVRRSMQPDGESAAGHQFVSSFVREFGIIPCGHHVNDDEICAWPADHEVHQSKPVARTEATEHALICPRCEWTITDDFPDRRCSMCGSSMAYDEDDPE